MFIAHYTSLETALAKIIPTQRLRFSSLESTNDPYEVHFDLHAGRIVSAGSEEEVDAAFERRRSEYNRIRENVAIGCFCCLGESDEPVSCANNHHLWTYYASGKDGVDAGCSLIFESESLVEEIEKEQKQCVWSDKVIYTNDYRDLRSSDPCVRSIFSRKPERWQVENEYRIIVDGWKSNHSPCETENDNYRFIDISTSLRGIVIPAVTLNAIQICFLNAISNIYSNGLTVYSRRYSPVQHMHTLDIHLKP